IWSGYRPVSGKPSNRPSGTEIRVHRSWGRSTARIWAASSPVRSEWRTYRSYRSAPPWRRMVAMHWPHRGTNFRLMENSRFMIQSYPGPAASGAAAGLFLLWGAAGAGLRQGGVQKAARGVNPAQGLSDLVQAPGLGHRQSSLLQAGQVSVQH